MKAPSGTAIHMSAVAVMERTDIPYDVGVIGRLNERKPNKRCNMCQVRVYKAHKLGGIDELRDYH